MLLLLLLFAWSRGSLRSICIDSGLSSKVPMLWGVNDANAQSVRVGPPGHVLMQSLRVVVGLPTRWLYSYQLLCARVKSLVCKSLCREASSLTPSTTRSRIRDSSMDSNWQDFAILRTLPRNVSKRSFASCTR